MMQRSARLWLFALAGLLLVIAQGVRAQQSTPGEAARDNSVRLSCRTPVTVTGAVIAPGRFVLQRRMRLAELIAASGGLSERAAKTVEIRRAGLNIDCDVMAVTASQQRAGAVEIYNLSEVLRARGKVDPEVQSGDRISIPEIGEAYVYGSVLQPRAIALKERITVTQAIEMVGGIATGGTAKRVRIMRGCNPTQTILVDLKAIEKGRAPDVVIEPFDIIFVPGMRVFLGPPLCHKLTSQTAEPLLRVIY